MAWSQHVEHKQSMCACDPVYDVNEPAHSCTVAIFHAIKDKKRLQKLYRTIQVQFRSIADIVKSGVTVTGDMTASVSQPRTGQFFAVSPIRSGLLQNSSFSTGRRLASFTRWRNTRRRLFWSSSWSRVNLSDVSRIDSHIHISQPRPWRRGTSSSWSRWTNYIRGPFPGIFRRICQCLERFLEATFGGRGRHSSGLSFHE